MKQALVALCSAALLVSCATVTREQRLVDRAVEAMGGAERIAALKTVTFKGTAKFWEPEQSDVPGGESRFVVDAPFEGIYDPASRARRRDVSRLLAWSSTTARMIAVPMMIHS